MDIYISLILILGVLFNLPIGFIAHKKKSLSMPDGIIAAGIVGYIIFIAHYLLWGLLFVFFTSSSLLTKYKEDSDIKIQAMEYAEKGGERDFIQVFANGGTAFIGSIILLISVGVGSKLLDTPLMLFVGVSLAASTSDTWSTEIGTSSTSNPVWIFHPMKRVPRGTSGGVTKLGFIGAFLGSSLIGISWLIIDFIIQLVTNRIIVFSLFDLVFLILLIIWGFLGSVVDTMLGATVQAVFQCPTCKKETEKTRHPKCNYVKTIHKRGIKWINNDTVNFLSSFIVSILALLTFIII